MLAFTRADVRDICWRVFHGVAWGLWGGLICYLIHGRDWGP